MSEFPVYLKVNIECHPQHQLGRFRSPFVNTFISAYVYIFFLLTKNMVILDMLNFQYKFIIRGNGFHCYVVNKEIQEIAKFLDIFFYLPVYIIDNTIKWQFI